MSPAPDSFMIVGDDGEPLAVVDSAKLSADATRLMYEMSAAAGDDAELDRIGTEWANEMHPDYFGYVCAGALSLMARCVLDPLLQVLDEVMPNAGFRAKLAESRDNAEDTLGGGQ
jgi:hypothetical protein